MLSTNQGSIFDFTSPSPHYIQLLTDANVGTEFSSYILQLSLYKTLPSDTLVSSYTALSLFMYLGFTQTPQYLLTICSLVSCEKHNFISFKIWIYLFQMFSIISNILFCEFTYTCTHTYGS